VNEMIFKRLIIFSIVFVQIFIAFNPARAMDSIVDDAPPVDESKPYIPVTADNLQDMTAQAAILIDATTGRVLYEKNPDAKAMPASTTKMMTCILGLENANDDDIVEVDKRAVGVEGSAIYINEGDKIKMSELLQATMLASGNDGAAAIAYYVGKGSLETFVQMMNDKAKEIGATNTHFNNPHGLTDPNHYTTARDLAKIARYTYQNEKFRKIVSTKEQEIQWVNPAERKDIYGSTNRLLWNYDDVTGIKTGYTDAAGGCLVASAQKNGVTLIAVVLKTSDSRARFVEGRALLDYGFKHIKEMKTVKEQIDSCPADRTDLIEEYQARYDVFNEYAPKLMSAEEVEAELKEKFADVIATKNKGQIMKTVMPAFKGRADGKVINQIVAKMCQ
jgi:D-alanyl-D-alanine carboxypeptidase (penicillin-binding protein 5/6)